MPKIIIDGREVECRDGIPVLQAAIEAGWDIPHYCYHPGLSIVASCRLCLMEMKMPHPQTKELGWAPKLLPSCQTPVRDGMEVRFNTEKVDENRERCMEYYLLNHPLDCPVCDQAGECYLQDYSYDFGSATSRMVEAKTKNPKKDIGSKTLLYQDRCVLCSRCVRFTREVTGSAELCIVNRGNKAEIDVFPGEPLENPMQGNVVDICPVGALLDKDFLMEQRVWMLRSAESICPGCSTGCAINVDHNEGRVWRVKPRFNPGVNDWWMCDEGRFGWKYIHEAQRIGKPVLRRGAGEETPDWFELMDVIRYHLQRIVRDDGEGSLAVMLSPFMACEEAWLLASFIRSIDPKASLTLGPVTVVGEDDHYPKLPAGQSNGNGAAVKFTIRSEKCPNRRGIEAILAKLAGPQRSRDELLAAMKDGSVKGGWIVGGYPQEWVEKPLVAAAEKVGWLVVQDLLPSGLSALARVVIPSCAFVEREGSFMNHAGLIQPFEPALPAPDGAMRDGQFLYQLAGHTGLYRGHLVRAAMATAMPEFAQIHVAPPAPEHAH